LALVELKARMDELDQLKKKLFLDWLFIK
jgi:hypothetical protein